VHRRVVFEQVDRLFVRLLLAQWAFGVLVALLVSPYGWEGAVKTTHVHVYAAVLLGGAITSLPVFLALTRSGEPATRHVVAVAQMLWSGLLIHLTGGRIETHFHIFGSLAFLAFYRDYRVLVPATLVVVGDHFLRGLLWPESVYGVAAPEWWRFLEHAFWVAFEDAVLVVVCLQGVKEMRSIARQRAELEELTARETQKSIALDEALVELTRSQEHLVRTEKLAAVGQLAASVGHELRNPLAAVRNAARYLRKRLDATKPALDPKVPQFLELIEREVGTCTRIIADLLDFARSRAPVLQPCPLRPLVDEASGLVPETQVRIVNAIPDELPVPTVDKEQFRQVLINLLQNAVEAIPPGRDGEVVVRAEGGGAEPWRIRVEDNGAGIPADLAAKIFEPLFTTKAKGTGLGLAIVANMIKAHRGTIHVESAADAGTSFVIELPATAAA
jgi:signal transduction histidine kinase